MARYVKEISVRNISCACISSVSFNIYHVFQTPLIMLSYLLLAGTVLTHLRKPIGPMTVKEQRLEGEYRHINSRLITNSEEIAFYQGNNREKLTLLASFYKLVSVRRYALRVS